MNEEQTSYEIGLEHGKQSMAADMAILVSYALITLAKQGEGKAIMPHEFYVCCGLLQRHIERYSLFPVDSKMFRNQP